MFAADDPPADSFSLIHLGRGVHVAASALRFQFARSSGPGGQNVNKLNTKAELWVPIAAIIGLSEAARQRLKLLVGKRLTASGEIHISADTERSQESNRQAVLDRLIELVRRAMVEPKVRRKTRPSRASRQKRLEGKKRRGEIKARRRGSAGDW